MTSSRKKKRLIVGVTGASGTILAQRLLLILKKLDIETHLVCTESAGVTMSYESELSIDKLNQLASVHYSNDNLAAAIASGSFDTIGMVVLPCSMNSLAQIALGLASNLLLRAATVTLKERRRLVLMPRETPLSAIHLEHMLKVTQMDGIIMPPIPAYYTKAQSINESTDQTLGRLLQLFNIDNDCFQEWNDSHEI